MKRGALSFALLFSLLLALLPVRFSTAGPALTSWSKARLECLVLNPRPEAGTFAVYGRLFVWERKWKLLGERFWEVVPATSQARKKLASLAGKGATLDGSFTSGYPFKTLSVSPFNQPPKPAVSDWVGFGKVLTSREVAKFNLTRVTDFVEILADLRDAVVGRNGERDREEFVLKGNAARSFAAKLRFSSAPEERAVLSRVRQWWKKSWNLKWLLSKDATTEAALRNAVGGSAFFFGQLCTANGYLTGVPATRRDIDAFMNTASTGGPANVVSGPTVMFARVTAVRDEYGRIVELYASGPLFETPKGLIQGIASRTQESETWRLEGWHPERAEVLDGEWCWLSGTRVLVYDEKGNLIDWYFSLSRSLTRTEFDSCLNLVRELIGKGGV